MENLDDGYVLDWLRQFKQALDDSTAYPLTYRPLTARIITMRGAEWYAR